MTEIQFIKRVGRLKEAVCAQYSDVWAQAFPTRTEEEKTIAATRQHQRLVPMEPLTVDTLLTVDQHALGLLYEYKAVMNHNIPGMRTVDEQVVIFGKRFMRGWHEKNANPKPEVGSVYQVRDGKILTSTKVLAFPDPMPYVEQVVLLLDFDTEFGDWRGDPYLMSLERWYALDEVYSVKTDTVSTLYGRRS